ncbi:MAG TPA: tetrapyrrole methylase, partial [Lachnospiraceae bacterium]|nr:tetrapyrrole methylase [Lachnospiraceae bacterium]
MSELDRLREIVERLRAKDGCPWDRAQTHETLKAPCIEEAAEVICGINILTETGNAENLQEELGDLLFQVLFHASLAEEEGLFTLEDVARTAADKMVRRHPHVFGESEFASEAAKDAAWEEIKKAEKAGREWQEPYLAAAMEEAG